MPSTIPWVVHISDSSEIDKGKDSRNEKKGQPDFVCCYLDSSFRSFGLLNPVVFVCAELLALVETRALSLEGLTKKNQSLFSQRAIGGGWSGGLPDFCLGRDKLKALPDLKLSGLPEGRVTTLLSLEHLNVNVPAWNSELEIFWMQGLGFKKDKRAETVCGNVKGKGGSLQAGLIHLLG